MKKTLPLFFIAIQLSCNPPVKKEDHHTIEVKKTTESLTIDGKATENTWNRAKWYPIDQNWLGKPYEHDDFNGRFKLVWDDDALYVLVEIVDDIVRDTHEDPLKLWWNDDSLQLFIDEDNSGGLHQYSHNAFAYNISLDGNVVDLAPDKVAKLYNENVLSARISKDNTSIWELAVKLYDSSFIDGHNNASVALSINKKIGFALAYCDNDNSTERENFIGSVFVPGEDKNQGWVNANIFGTLILTE